MLSLDSTGMRGGELCEFPSITQELWVPVPAATWASQSGALCLFESLLCLQCPTKLGSQWLLKKKLEHLRAEPPHLASFS